MRVDPIVFSLSNESKTQSPVFVVEIAFDEANTDLHYLSKGSVLSFGGTILNTCIESISGTSQKINPDKANATIGSMNFSCLDDGITELLRNKLTEDKGLSSKRVRIYKGFVGDLWSQYQLIQTQVIDSKISYKDGVYRFHCADIQRALRKKIFIAKETVLTSSITAEQSTIPALNTSLFESVYQVPSAQGKTLLRALQQSGDYPDLAGVDHIGLIKIENEDDFEIALWYEKNDLTNIFTKVIRGVLGSTALDVEVDVAATSQNAPKITEYIYLNMPAVKLAYAVKTGALYGHAGEYLPDHWHLGISTDYIKTSDFVNIGTDIWDVNDDDAGYPAVVKGYSDIDGKKFLEQDIFYALGLYAPVLATGELSLKRLSYIGPNGGYVRELNESNVASYEDLEQDLDAVVNSFILKWNWDERKEKYTRNSVLIDPLSITRHTGRDPKIIELKSLHGSRHSDNLIKFHFDAIRSRYAGPPLRLSLTLTPDQNGLEVGDIVRVNLQNVRDATAETSGPLNRNFEIQSVSTDWISGKVKVNLFGSSQRASDIPPKETETVAAAFVASEGTEITAANFPSAGITSSGGTTTVTGPITFAGNADMNNSSAIYYCNEDLTFAATSTPIISDNVQIRVNGFLQGNEVFDGKGRGHSGGAGVSGDISSYATANRGIVGIGSTLSQRGASVQVTRAHSGDGYFSSYGQIDGQLITGNPFYRPALNIDASGNLSGMPSDLRGTSGSGGMSSYEHHITREVKPNGGGYDYATGFTERVAGGAGGAGGAGLAIFSKGMSFGVGGGVDLSGGDGLIGDVTTYMQVAGGSGAGGAPGGFIYVALDSTQTFPDFSSGFALNQGVSPQQGYMYGDTIFHNVATDSAVSIRTSIASSRYVGSASEVENLASQHGHIVFIDTRSTAVEDEAPYVESKPDFSLTEYLNTPVTPDGNQTTIEVSITPPSDDNYSYSVVDYRKQGDTAWINNGPAAPEGLIQVPSDGSIYEVMVRAVSKAKNASLSGIIKTIALTNVSGRTNAELATIYPLTALTGFQVVGGGLVFTGLDCGVTWSNDNAELAYFNHYEIEVYDGATLLRTEQSVSPFYVYTYEKNRSDYLAENAAAGVYLAFEIRVSTVSKYRNDVSELYATSAVALTFTATTANNPQNLRFYTHVDVNDERINNNNATPYTLVAPSSNVTVVGATIENINTVQAWIAGPHSKESYANGAFVSFAWDDSSKHGMVGLSSVPDDANAYQSLSHAFYFRGSAINVYEDNVNIGTIHGAYQDGDVFGIVYDSLEVHYLRNGVKIRSVASAANRTFYFDSAFRDVGAKASSIQFGPLTAATDYKDDRVNNNVATPFTLIPTAECRVDGAKITCLVDNNKTEGVYSQESIVGGAFVSFKIPATDKGCWVGMESSPISDPIIYPIDYSIDPIDYSISTIGDGNFHVRQYGMNAGTDEGEFETPLTAGDTFYIAYDGTSVRYHHNGRLIRTVSAAPGLRLHFNGSFDDAGAGVEAVQFGPYGSNDWNQMGGSNKPADNATNGATWGGDIAAQPTDSRLLGNLFDLSEWEPNPSVSLSGWTVAGTAATELAYEAGPELNGHTVLAFHAWNDGGSDAIALTSDGIPIEADGTYRVSFFAKGAATLAKTRLKVEGDLIELDDTAIPTPPTYQIGFDDLDEDWYLLVGVVRRHNTVVTVNSNYSGIYNVQTGERVKAVDDVKFEPTATTLVLKMESDIIDAGDHVYFYKPRIELMDGTEPSVAALIGTPERRYVAQDTAPIMFGVASAGTKITSNGENITTSKTGTGDYRLNHTGGYSGYPVVITPRSGNVDRIDVSESAGYIRVRFYDTTNAAIDSAFSAMVDFRYNA